MLYPSDINYVRFSDTQVSLFAQHAESECGVNPWWREDLDEAARDLIIGHITQQWDSPSAIIKKLKSITKNPGRFFDQLDSGGAGAISDPVATALRHGTGWTDEQLLDAANHRDEFLQGVGAEIAFLEKIIEWRKAMGRRGNVGNPAMEEFVNRLALVYQDAFLLEPSVTTPKGNAPGGSFVQFSKAVVAAVAGNLSIEVTKHYPLLRSKLRQASDNDNSSIFHYLTESSACYKTNVMANQFQELMVALQEWAKTTGQSEGFRGASNISPQLISNLAEGRFNALTPDDLNKAVGAANLGPVSGALNLIR